MPELPWPIHCAIQVAFAAHDGQTRKYTGEPYICHPIRVYGILRRFGLTSEVLLAAALLHDVIEDTDLGFDDIAEQVGLDVANLVEEVTDEYTKEKYPSENRAWRKRREAFRLASASKQAMLIKLADLIDNTTSMDPSDDFVDVYAREKDAVLEAISCAHHDLADAARDALNALLLARGRHKDAQARKSICRG